MCDVSVSCRIPYIYLMFTSVSFLYNAKFLNKVPFLSYVAGGDDWKSAGEGYSARGTHRPQGKVIPPSLGIGAASFLICVYGECPIWILFFRR
jgi:hypothetical protein